jgi:HSP20 family protein
MINSIDETLTAVKTKAQNVITSFKDDIYISKNVGERIDEKTKQKMWYVDVELPGYDKVDVEIEVTIDGDKVLHVKAEKTVEEQTKTSIKKSQSEKRVKISLPDNVDDTKHSAIYKNGLLRVEMPLKEKPKEKSRRTKIPVKRG